MHLNRDTVGKCYFILGGLKVSFNLREPLSYFSSLHLMKDFYTEECNLYIRKMAIEFLWWLLRNLFKKQMPRRFIQFYSQRINWHLTPSNEVRKLVIRKKAVFQLCNVFPEILDWHFTGIRSMPFLILSNIFFYF